MEAVEVEHRSLVVKFYYDMTRDPCSSCLHFLINNFIFLCVLQVFFCLFVFWGFSVCAINGTGFCFKVDSYDMIRQHEISSPWELKSLIDSQGSQRTSYFSNLE